VFLEVFFLQTLHSRQSKSKFMLGFLIFLVFGCAVWLSSIPSTSHAVFNAATRLRDSDFLVVGKYGLADMKPIYDQEWRLKALPSGSSRGRSPWSESSELKAAPLEFSKSMSRLPPIVAVCIPFTCSKADGIMETLESIRRQSFQQFEIVISCDRCDACRGTVEKIKSLDERIKLFDVPNESHGAPGARNFATSNSVSEFYYFLDADDLLEPTSLEKMIAVLKTNPNFAITKGYCVGFGAQSYLWTATLDDSSRFWNENMVTSSFMIRRDVFHAVNRFDESMVTGLEDMEFWFRLSRSGYWGNSIREPVDWYRRRSNHVWADPRNIENKENSIRERYPELSNPNRWPQVSWPGMMDRSDAFKPLFVPSSGENGVNILPRLRKRLLFIMPWMVVGGVDKTNLNLMKGLQARGWDFTIVTTLESKNDWEDVFMRYSDDIHVLDRFLPKLTDRLRYIVHLIESRQVDCIVVTNSMLGYGGLPLIRRAADKLNPPAAVLDWVHMEQPEWKNGGYPAMSKTFNRYLDRTLVASKYLMNWMVQENEDDKTRLRLGYIGVDNDYSFIDHEALGELQESLSPDGVPIILFAARMVDQKQPMMMAEIFAELVKRKKKFVAVIVGDGERWSDVHGLLSKIRQSHRSQKILLTKSLTPEYVTYLMQAADIFFMPSTMEGISLSMYEAMASGTVPVVADVGGQKEIVPPGCDCAHLIQSGPFSKDDYITALESLLENPRELERMGLRAREAIGNHFSLEHTLNQFEKVFNEVRAKVPTHKVVNNEEDINEDVLHVVKFVLDNFSDGYRLPGFAIWITVLITFLFVF